MLSAVIVPFNFSTSSCTIDRPRPLPFSDRPLSHLYSRSKICFKSSLSIPIPLSDRRIFIFLFCSDKANSILSAWLWEITFCIRLFNIRIYPSGSRMGRSPWWTAVLQWIWAHWMAVWYHKNVNSTDRFALEKIGNTQELSEAEEMELFRADSCRLAAGRWGGIQCLWIKCADGNCCKRWFNDWFVIVKQWGRYYNLFKWLCKGGRWNIPLKQKAVTVRSEKIKLI